MQVHYFCQKDKCSYNFTPDENLCRMSLRVILSGIPFCASRQLCFLLFANKSFVIASSLSQLIGITVKCLCLETRTKIEKKNGKKKKKENREKCKNKPPVQWPHEVRKEHPLFIINHLEL